MKPFMGRITNWSKVYFDVEAHKEQSGDTTGGLGYYIVGECMDHPRFGRNKFFHTSYVEHHGEDGMITTRNSKYQLVGEESNSKAIDVV